MTVSETIKYTRICDQCCYELRVSGQLMSMQTAYPMLARPEEICESCGSYLLDWGINQATVIL